MIDNLNTPAAIEHQKDGKTYRILGTILSLNESDNTCTMSFQRGGRTVIKNDIPMDMLILNEGIIDSLKAAGQWAKDKFDKVLDFVCKKVGRFICAIVDGVKIELRGMPINAYEATKNSKGIKVFPSAAIVEEANQSGMSVNPVTDSDKIVASVLDEYQECQEVRKFWERIREAFVGTVDEPAPEDRTIEEAIRIVYNKYYPVNVLYEANGIEYKNHRVLNEDITAEEAANKEGHRKIVSLTSNRYPNVDKYTLTQHIFNNIKSQIEGNVLYPDGQHYATIEGMIEEAKERYESYTIEREVDGKPVKYYKPVGAGIDKEILWDDFVADKNVTGWLKDKPKYIKIGSQRVLVPGDFKWEDEKNPIDRTTGKFRANYLVRVNSNKEFEFAANERTMGDRYIKRQRSRPLMIWGAPGIGKTSILKTAADIYADTYKQAKGIDKNLTLITLCGSSMQQDDVSMILPREKTVGQSDNGDINIPVALVTPNSVLPVYKIPSKDFDNQPGHPIWTMLDNLYNGGSWTNSVPKDLRSKKKPMYDENGQIMYDEDGEVIFDQNNVVEYTLRDSGDRQGKPISLDAAADYDLDDVINKLLATQAAEVKESQKFMGNALNEARAKGYIAFFDDERDNVFRDDFPDIWEATRQNWYKAYLSAPAGTSPYAPALSQLIALGFKEAWARHRQQHNGEDVNVLFKKFWGKYTKPASLSAHLGTHSDDDKNRTSPLNASPGPNGEPSIARKYIENASGNLAIATPAPKPVTPPVQKEVIEPVEEPVQIEDEELPVNVRNVRQAMRQQHNIQNFDYVNDGGILFIDEFSRMGPQTKSAIMTLFSDKCIGDYVLASKWAIIGAANRVSELSDTAMRKWEDEVAFASRLEQYNFVPYKSDFLEWAKGTVKDAEGNDTSITRLPQDLIDMIEYFDDGAWFYAVDLGSWEYVDRKDETNDELRMRPWGKLGPNYNFPEGKGAFGKKNGYSLVADLIFNETKRQYREENHIVDYPLNGTTFDYKAMLDYAFKPEVVQAGGATDANPRIWEAIGIRYYQMLYDLGISQAIVLFKGGDQGTYHHESFKDIIISDKPDSMSADEYEQMEMRKLPDAKYFESAYVSLYEVMKSKVFTNADNRKDRTEDISLLDEFEKLKPQSLINPERLTPKHMRARLAKLWLIYYVIPTEFGADTLAPYEAKKFEKEGSLFTKSSMDEFVRTGAIGINETVNINDFGWFYDPSGQFTEYLGRGFFGHIPNLMWKSNGNELNAYFEKIVDNTFPTFLKDVQDCVNDYTRDMRRLYNPAVRTNVKQTEATLRTQAYDDMIASGQANTSDDDNLNPSFTGMEYDSYKDGKNITTRLKGAAQDVVDSQISANSTTTVTVDDFWIPPFDINDYNKFVDFCSVKYQFIYCTNPKVALNYISKDDEAKKKAESENNTPNFTQSTKFRTQDVPVFLLPEDTPQWVSERDRFPGMLKKEAIHGDPVVFENPWPDCTSTQDCRDYIQSILDENPDLVINKQAESENATPQARQIFAIVNFANMVYMFKKHSRLIERLIRVIVEISRVAATCGYSATENVSMVFSRASDGYLLKNDVASVDRLCRGVNNCFDPINFMIYYGTSVGMLCDRFFRDYSVYNPELLQEWVEDYQALDKNGRTYQSYIDATGFDPANPPVSTDVDIEDDVTNDDFDDDDDNTI